MRELHHTDPIALELIKSLYRGSRLIPFIGAGFTKDLRAKNGKVPDAKTLTKMITELASSKNGLSVSDVDEVKSISDLKTAFELLSMTQYVSSNQAQAILASSFSKVDISDAGKKNFLKLDWPHIFTFNIDDGIESSTRLYKVLRPNREVSREFINSNNCLFKIHGDISEFIEYKDPNVVFTWRDYAHSIEKNKAMLSFLEEQSKHSSLLFIGCSLDAEVDLLHLSQTTKFSNSIYLKRGKPTLQEKIVLKSYGIEQVIIFDTYEDIYTWLVGSLRNESREIPFQDLSIDDSVVSNGNAISLIANGGPLMSIAKSGHRVARKPDNFATRTKLKETLTALQSHECILITGRRFSGKTLFLLQLIDAAKQFNSNFYASTDIFYPAVKRLITGAENTIFVFDSNYLNSQSLGEVLDARMHASSRIIMCASGGDAEIFRFKFEQKNVNFLEIKLSDQLDSDESQKLNFGLTSQGLPNYQERETLLNFSFRYYNEFKAQLNRSDLFDKHVDETLFAIMVLVSAFEKAESSHIESISPYFDFSAFVNKNDIIFECEKTVTGTYVITCNSSAWLITMLGGFIKRYKSAVEVVSNIITSLSKNGFDVAAQNMISFDKLNEIGGGSNSFIRNIYLNIQEAYSQEKHYWLQRAKCELISGDCLADFRAGMRYASKVRLDSAAEKNQTYYSATLVMAQLCTRAFKAGGGNELLLEILNYSLESFENYRNNRRHVNKFIAAYFNRKSDVRYAFDALESAGTLELLARKKHISDVKNFFEINKKVKNFK